MPKTVDHEEKRHLIAQAVWRLAAQGGLEGVSMRHVAAAAGVSTRLVQYYFGTRDALLADALSYRREHDRQRLAAVVSPDATVRETLRGVLLDLLPIDEEGRAMYLLNVAYFIRALSDPGLVSRFDGEPSLEDRFLEFLKAAATADELVDNLNLPLEAERLLALQDGMSSRLLLGMRSPEDAAALIDYHLDRVFRSQR